MMTVEHITSIKTGKIIFLIYILFHLNEDVFALKPGNIYKVRPENYDLIYREINIKTPDGYTIKTWFFPVQKLNHSDSTRKDWPYFTWERHQTRNCQAVDTLPKPTVIFCDGDADNMGGWIVFAPYFVSRGYNVVTFDWRGFGESDPFPTDTALLCYPEYLIDYNAVIDSIAKLKEVDANNIGIFGYSTGAYLSFAAAYKNPNVKCLAVGALMTSFDDFLPFLYKAIPYKRETVKKPENYPIELYPINIAPHFNKPVLLIVGEKDVRTPSFMTESIYKKMKTRHKKIWKVKNAEHGGAKSPLFINMEHCERKMLNFFDDYLKNETVN